MNELTNYENKAIQSTTLTADMLESFINYLDASPKTIQTYHRAIRQFMNYLYSNGITQPIREDVLTWREELKEDHAPSTVQNYVIAVRLFFQWTAQVGLYPNIAEHVKGAKISKEHKKDFLNSNQLKAVINKIDRSTAQGRRDYAIFVLMATCGLRDIEVNRANVEDLRSLGDNTVLYIQGKGKEERTDYVKIMPEVEEAIRKTFADRDNTDGREPLFISMSNNSKGGRMSTRSISKAIKTALVNAGYDSSRLTAHSLRHSAVTLALLGGNSLQEVQMFARHSSISTTQIYAHNLDRANNQCENTIAQAIF